MVISAPKNDTLHSLKWCLLHVKVFCTTGREQQASLSYIFSTSFFLSVLFFISISILFFFLPLLTFSCVIFVFYIFVFIAPFRSFPAPSTS